MTTAKNGQPVDFIERLKGVHPDLIKLILEAGRTSPIRLRITEGVRTKERQKLLYDQGKSRTMASKHLLQSDGFGHAFDVVPVLKDGSIPWDDKKVWREVYKHILATAKRLKIRVRSGADWDMNNVIDEMELLEYRLKFGRKPLVDYPHYELVK